MMKFILILITSFIVLGCDYFRDSEENFVDAYKNILVAREKYKNDSLKAEKQIKKIYDEYGYTQESFKEEFFNIAHKDTRRFYDLLDSIREKVRLDLIEEGKKKSDLNKK